MDFLPPTWVGRQWNGGDSMQRSAPVHRSTFPTGPRAAALRQHVISLPAPVLANADMDLPTFFPATAGLAQVQISQYKFR